MATEGDFIPMVTTMVNRVANTIICESVKVCQGEGVFKHVTCYDNR